MWSFLMFKTSYLNLNSSIPFRQLGHPLFGRHNPQQLAKDGLPENEPGNTLPRRRDRCHKQDPRIWPMHSTGWAPQATVTGMNKTQLLPSRSSSSSTCFALGSLIYSFLHFTVSSLKGRNYIILSVFPVLQEWISYIRKNFKK